ncbi:MAG: phosphoenolpyruvate--protein phosphotransferase [Fibrobacteraceae bacterium]|nr:phosphoenolpyruvate--protein phosphotransferase [Fibrobacteraceae bacterium]
MKTRTVLVGVAASPGYAVGSVQKIANRTVTIDEAKLPAERLPAEEQLFLKALDNTTRDINNLKTATVQRLGINEARIFDAHLMMLKDPTLLNSILASIKQEGHNASWAVHSSLSALIAQFEKSKSEVLRERAMDLKELYNRLLAALGDSGPVLSSVPHKDGSIIVAHELTPGTLISLKRDEILGFATDSGGRTSHFSILARSMQIPAVSGLRNVSLLIENGDTILIDGTGGMVIVNPNEEDLRHFEEKLAVFNKQKQELFTMRQLEPMTRDGKYITLLANIELPLEADNVLDFGATGIGLYRSEFLFFRKGMPTCAEQAEAYSYILRTLKPFPVVIRTLDAGGDKLVSDVSASEEANPFMGWRSIRVCLSRKDLFKDQLKALLLASVEGNLRIMFPMISGLNELREAKALYQECRTELLDQGKELPKVKIGAMIEVPAAVMMVEALAKEVDFFSIGTNDLIQFTLAVDRTNELIANMFEPHHPAVLNMIDRVVRAAHREGIPVCVCGEMSSDPLSTLVLVGLGVDELSMTPWSIMECKKIIRSVNYEDAKATAKAVLKLDDAQSVNRYLRQKYLQTITDLGISSFITSHDVKDSLDDNV